jgi:type I restriction enzyme R subunit
MTMPPLPFKPFNESGPVRIYYNGLLPHWRQAGCTYFVTFRLADSVPRAVLDQWLHERDCWLKARGAELKGHNWPAAIKQLSRVDRKRFERHFVSQLFEYLDRGYGSCVLQQPNIAKIAADSLVYFQGVRLDVGDFVIMPNHVHALMTPYAGFELEDIIQSIKSFTSNQINRELKRTGTLWMRESYDRIVRDGEELLRIQPYIRANPEKAGLSKGEYALREAEYDLRPP